MGFYDKKPEATDFELEGKDDYLMRPGYGGMKPRDIHKAEQQRHDSNAKALLGSGAVGANEAEAVEAAETVTQPLVLNADFVARSPSYVGKYENSYNLYTMPMRQTLYSMGRLKDLQDAGAPLSPAELKADKKLAKRFKPLSDTKDRRRGGGSSDAQARGDFSAWGQRQSTLNADFDSFRDSQNMLQTAVMQWNRALMILDRRAMEAERQGKMAEKALIDSAAETLVRIVDVSKQAMSMVTVLNGFANARHGEIIDTSGDPPEFGRGLTTGALEGAADKGTPWASRGQKAANHAGALAENAAIVNKSKFIELAKANSGISLKDVFIVMMGDAGKYIQLERDIAVLTQQIALVNDKIEIAEIKTAWKHMQDMTLVVSTAEQKLNSDVFQAREAAKTFNQSMNGGTKGLMAMYACEAYQELAQFGGEAYDQVKQVYKLGRYTDGFAGRKKLWMEAEGYITEIHTLRSSLRRVYSQKQLLDQRAPEWHAKALEWRGFLGGLTKKDLLTYEP